MLHTDNELYTDYLSDKMLPDINLSAVIYSAILLSLYPLVSLVSPSCFSHAHSFVVTMKLVAALSIAFGASIVAAQAKVAAKQEVVPQFRQNAKRTVTYFGRRLHIYFLYPIRWS